MRHDGNTHQEKLYKKNSYSTVGEENHAFMNIK